MTGINASEQINLIIMGNSFLKVSKC